MADGKWHRFSTRKASLENAIAAACDMYDEARYRQRLGLAHRTHTFAQNAAITMAEMRQQIDLSKGKTAVHSYATCIEKYFLPYFGSKRMGNSAAMIERHYSKLTATMAADRLA